MVSILLAVYNGEKYLRSSIESIINQTYEDFELLIGFNGTVDNSKDIVKEFKDKRIRVFDYGMDKGKSKTLNKLLKKAKGEWLAMQDDDDVWLPKKLELQMNLATTGEYDVIGSRIFYCNELEKITGQPKLFTEHDKIVSLSMKGNNQIANSSAIFRTSITKEINGWDESLSGIEDFDFWLKLMKKGCRFVNLKKQLVLHRVHKDSNFNTKTHDIKSVIEKYQ
jgi:glycosyltransferase involved in cell wall biosynthesis